MHAKSMILCFCVVLYSLPFGRAKYPWEAAAEDLKEAKNRFANSKSDIFFLMDDSDSLISFNHNGFEDEKDFIVSMLSDIRITKDATRVAIIRFGTEATIDINYISNLSGLNNKCAFKEAFDKLKYRGFYTNMKGAFEKVNEVLFGTNSQFVRSWKRIDAKSKIKPVKKVVFLITDGIPNIGGDPKPIIHKMKYEDQIELFSVGVANAKTNFLKFAATSSDHYFYANSFEDFADLSTYIRGGT